MPRVRLTDDLLNALASHLPRGEWVFDLQTPGLGVWIGPPRSDARGRPLPPRRSWFVQLPAGEGRRTRKVIGEWPALPLSKARRLAESMRRDAASALAAGEQVATGRGRREPIRTLADLIDAHLADPIVQGHVSYRAERAYLLRARGMIGNVRLAALGPEHAKRWYQSELDHGVTTASRAWGTLAAVCNNAVRRGVLASNPLRRVAAHERKRPPSPRTRFLSSEENARLDAAIAAEPDPRMRSFWRVLRVTGCRQGEARKAKWGDMRLDGTAPEWVLSTSKTGKARVIALAATLAAELRAYRATIDPPPTPDRYVWEGYWGRPIQIPERWRALRDRASIPADLHLHDVRRSVGRDVLLKHGLKAASLILGHSNVAVTASTYSPLGLEDLRPIAEALAAAHLGHAVPSTPEALNPTPDPDGRPGAHEAPQPPRGERPARPEAPGPEDKPATKKGGKPKRSK